MTRHRGRAMIAALIAAFCITGITMAQIQTGNIFGKVQSNDGTPLPGVTVTLTGVGAPSVFTTDNTGSFRFMNLSPGTYELKADLAGMGSVVRQGIAVNIGHNTDLTLALNPTTSEAITITAASPLLDVRRTGTGATITKVELEKVPTGRDPWVILQQTPGVLLDRLNVGGSESGQQSTYTAKGIVGAQATWNVDGVNITDVGALGSSPTYYDFDSFDEMQVTTGGSDVRIQTAGVQLNMVTKRGTNDFKGSGRYLKTSGSLQATPRIPAEAHSYLAHTNQLDKVDDYGAEVGGPLLHDRLWFWGAYGKQTINTLTAQGADARSIAAGRFHDNTLLENRNAKLNAQITSSNSFVGTYSRGDKTKFGRGVGPLVEQAASFDQGAPTDIEKVEDTQIFSQSLYVTGMFSHLLNRFSLIPDSGKRCTTIDCALQSPPAYFDDTGVQRQNSTIYVTRRPQTQYRADASSFFNTGSISHELKFGFGYRKAAVSSYTTYAADQLIFFSDPPGKVGATGGVNLYRPTNYTYDVNSTDAYAGDTFLAGNLTAQAGVRFDGVKAGVRGGATVANSLIPDILPAISFTSAQVGKINWHNISPRLAVTYSAGADRRTLLRAAANRYADQVGGAAVYEVSPTAYQYLYYYFTDLNGDKRVQRNELNLADGPAGWVGLDPAKTTVANSPFRYADHLKDSHTDELIVGIEREVLSDFAVAATGTYRKVSDFLFNVAEKTQGKGDYYTRDDYVLASTPAKTTLFGQPYSLPYYVLRPGVPAPVYFVEVNLPNYHQTYKGVDFTATKRMSHRWMLRGSVSLNDWRQHAGPNAFPDPTHQKTNVVSCSDCPNGTVTQGLQTGRGSKGGVYINSRWQANVTGAYQIPIIETSLGFNLIGRQGYPIPYSLRVNTSEGFKYLLLGSDVDTYRQPNVFDLDLRLAKEINIARAGVTFSVDAFNVLNRNTILQRSVRLESPSRGRITEVQAPRVLRVGARLSF